MCKKPPRAIASFSLGFQQSRFIVNSAMKKTAEYGFSRFGESY
jgi:hypothetical protein